MERPDELETLDRPTVTLRYRLRDDEEWLRPTLVWKTDPEPSLDYKPVTNTTWKPVERKY